MWFFTSSFFWFLEGICACLIVLGLKSHLEERNIRTPLWKWILFCLWLLLAGFTIAFITTSLGENEIDAAFKGGIVFGVITVITGAGLWRLLFRGARVKSIES